MIEISSIYYMIYNIGLAIKSTWLVKSIFLISNTLFYIFLGITVPISMIYAYISIKSIINKKRSNKDKQIEEENNDYFPFITIQIPTYNELAAINCAKRCLKFDYPKNKYEILIGDDSNKPEISRKLKDFADKHKLIKIIKRERNIGFKPGNLNNMINHSRGEFIAIFDSDFLPPPNFLKKGVLPFKGNKDVAAVQTRWEFTNPHQNAITTLATTVLIITHHIMMPFVSKRGIVHLCGSAEIVRKSTLKKLGCWINGYLTEDIEYTLRLLKNNYKLVYLENLECKGEVPYLAKDYYKQQMRWAYGAIKAYIEHGKDILFSKSLTPKQKYTISLIGSGYVITLLLEALIVTGVISFFTNPGMEINISQFLYQFTRNVLLTCGLLFAGITGLIITKKTRYTGSVIKSSFTYGFGAIYYVNKGIFKAIFNKPMHWYMLNKIGNNQANP